MMRKHTELSHKLPLAWMLIRLVYVRLEPLDKSHIDSCD